MFSCSMFCSFHSNDSKFICVISNSARDFFFSSLVCLFIHWFIPFNVAQMGTELILFLWLWFICILHTKKNENKRFFFFIFFEFPMLCALRLAYCLVYFGLTLTTNFPKYYYKICNWIWNNNGTKNTSYFLHPTNPIQW